MRNDQHDLAWEPSAVDRECRSTAAFPSYAMRLLRKELSLLKERTQSVGGVVVFSELCLVSSTLRQASFAYIYIYIYIYYTPAGLLSIVHSRSVSIPVER